MQMGFTFSRKDDCEKAIAAYKAAYDSAVKESSCNNNLKRNILIEIVLLVKYITGACRHLSGKSITNQVHNRRVYILMEIVLLVKYITVVCRHLDRNSITHQVHNRFGLSTLMGVVLPIKYMYMYMYITGLCGHINGNSNGVACLGGNPLHSHVHIFVW